METHQTNRTFWSLRGRIWAAAIGLAFIDCIAGSLVFYAAHYLLGNEFTALAAALVTIVGATIGLAYWLTKEIVTPVERVALLARSMERSSSVSLPESTGSVETDELLDSISRNSRQIYNLIALMDDVSAGNTAAAMAPLQNPDRLSISFQKLVSRVTDSIDAKAELDRLRASINSLSNDLLRLRKDSIDPSVIRDNDDLQPVVDTLRTFALSLATVSRTVATGVREAKDMAAKARLRLHESIQSVDGDTIILRRSLDVSTELIERSEMLAQEMENSREFSQDSGTILSSASDSLSAVKDELDRLGKTVFDVVAKTRKLRVHASEFPKAGINAANLAKRSNLIALNEAVRTPEGSASVIVKELNSLKTKAEALNEQLNSAGDGLVEDLEILEAALKDISESAHAVAEMQKSSAESVSGLADSQRSLDELKKVVSARYSEYKADLGEVSDALIRLDAASENSGSGMREAENDLSDLLVSVQSLSQAVKDIGVSPSVDLGSRITSPISWTATSNSADFPSEPIN